MNCDTDNRPQQQWIRHEIKYRLQNEALGAFNTYAQNLLEADPNSLKQGGYLNYSIYFDAPSHRFLNEKEEGLEVRTKPRLRVYKDIVTGAPLNYFFELKHRRGAFVFKERTQIDRQLSLDFLSEYDFSNHLSNPVISHVLYLFRRYQIQPTICVLYKRQAFQSSLYPGLRVTYDSQISGSFNISLDTPREEFLPVLPANETILEIKYNRHRPNLISEAVKRLELQQISYSKYVETMHALPRSYSSIRPL